MQLHGTIKHIFDTQTVSDKFKKREFVVITEANTPYPQPIKLEFTQDKCSLLDKYQEGQEVSVDFNLRGNEWNGPKGQQFFNTLQAWKIEAVNNAQPTANTQNSAANNQSVATNIAPNPNDDLPF